MGWFKSAEGTGNGEEGTGNGEQGMGNVKMWKQPTANVKMGEWGMEECENVETANSQCGNEGMGNGAAGLGLD